MNQDAPTTLSPQPIPALVRRSGSGGFTLIEMIIVVVVLGILGLIAIPRISKQVNESKIRQAASVVAGDLEQAVSLAARSRRPLVIRCDCANRTLLLRDRGVADSVRLRRAFNVGSGLEVTTMTLTPDSVVVFPDGILSDTLAVRLDGPDGYTRTVTLSRAGRVRVVAP